MEAIQQFFESFGLSWIEWVALALLLYGGIMGLKNGFLKELAGTVGFFLGLFIAWQFYEQLGGGTLAFLALWIFTPIALSLAATLATKLLDWTVVGGFVNRLLGCLFGLLKWAALIICLLVLVDETAQIDKFVDHKAIPGVSYLETQWKTLRETL